MKSAETLLSILTFSLQLKNCVVLSECKDLDYKQCGQFCGYPDSSVCDCGGEVIGDETGHWCSAHNCSSRQDGDTLHVTCPRGSEALLPEHQSADHACRDTFFPCEDGEKCVDARDMCRGEQLCRDGSDLRACYSTATWTRQDFCFPCDHFPGQCKPFYGEKKIFSCFDRSFTIPMPSLMNYAGLFPCKDEISLIKASDKCNGYEDCPDGSDENPDLCKLKGEFACRADNRALQSNLVCDGWNNCDDLSDEDLVLCKERYIEEGWQKPQGHYPCKRTVMKYHTGGSTITILAVACDGDVECNNGEDESPTLCNLDSRTIYFIVICSSLFLTGLSILLGKCNLFSCPGTNCDTEEDTFFNLVNLNNDQYELNEVEYINCHTQGKIGCWLPEFLSLLHHLSTKKEGKVFLRKIFKLEVNIHAGCEKRAKICLLNAGNYRRSEIVKLLLDIKSEPIEFDEMKPNIIKKHSKLSQCFFSISPLVSLAKQTCKIGYYYIDMWTGMLLVLSILLLTNKLKISENFIHLVIVPLLIITIVTPYWLYGISLAVRAKQDNPQTRFSKQILMFLFSPIVPAVKLYHVTKLKTDRDDYYENIRNAQEICEDTLKRTRKINNDIRELQESCGDFKKFEMSNGKISLVTIQLFLLAWGITISPVLNTNRNIFSSESSLRREIFISLFLVMASFVLTSDLLAGGKKQAKFLIKLLNIIQAGLLAISKIVANMLFFTPSLGLFGLMAHYVREKEFILTFGNLNDNGTDLGNYTYLASNDSVVTIPWNWIERGNQFHRPESTLYTGLSLNYWVVVFLAISLLQLVMVFCIKIAFSTQARKELNKNIFLFSLHVLQNKQYILPSREWEKSESNHQNSWKEQRSEVLALTVLHLVENWLLLIPIWCTVPRIRERHELIGEAFPRVFDEEIQAYDLGSRLVWLVPIMQVFAAVLQYLIFLLINIFLHPFKELISNHGIAKNDDGTTEDCVLMESLFE